MASISVNAWPRGLSEDLAAAYVGLSASSFRSYVMPAVAPVHLTPNRQVWLRDDLDTWLDQKAGKSIATAKANDDDEDDEWGALIHAQKERAAGLRR